MTLIRFFREGLVAIGTEILVDSCHFCLAWEFVMQA